MMAWKGVRGSGERYSPARRSAARRYIKALKAPFPQIPLIASGGVNQQTASEFIRCGALALGIREELIPAEAVKNRDQTWILELTHRFQAIVNRARLHN